MRTMILDSRPTCPIISQTFGYILKPFSVNPRILREMGNLWSFSIEKKLTYPLNKVTIIETPLQWCSYKAKSQTLSDNNSQMSYRFQQARTKCPIKTKFWRTMSDCGRV